MTVLEKVKSNIKSFIVKDNMDEGHMFNAASYFTLNTLHYNPKEKEVEEQAFAELVDEGIFEEKAGNYILTKKGVDTVYI